MIGLTKPISLEVVAGHVKKTRLSANHSAVLNHDHQTTEFRQTTGKLLVQWLTPPREGEKDATRRVVSLPASASASSRRTQILKPSGRSRDRLVVRATLASSARTALESPRRGRTLVPLDSSRREDRDRRLDSKKRFAVVEDRRTNRASAGLPNRVVPSLVKVQRRPYSHRLRPTTASGESRVKNMGLRDLLGVRKAPDANKAPSSSSTTSVLPEEEVMSSEPISSSFSSPASMIGSGDLNRLGGGGGGGAYNPYRCGAQP